MRIRLTVPSKHVDAETLGAGLEASTVTAQRQVRDGNVPTLDDAIASGQVKWRPEPAKQGFEGFDLPEDVYARGWGDCDDLAAWHCAELRESGEDPDAKCVVYESKPGRWHAVVERYNGSIDDPSRWAGMGKPGGPLPVTESHGVSCVGFTKTRSGATRARLDIPLVGWAKNVGIALERAGADPYEALSNVSNRALALLGFWGAPDDVIFKMHAISHLLSGRGEEDFARLTGCGYVDCGDFVGALAERVGATYSASMQPDAGKIADVAATIIDPFGLRNLVAPLASQFVQSYAGGLANRGTPQATAHLDVGPAQCPPCPSPRRTQAQPSADASVSGEDEEYMLGDDCPPGYHWALHGGVWLCEPKDASLSGHAHHAAVQGALRFRHPVVGRGAPSRGPSRGGSSPARGGRGSSSPRAAPARAPVVVPSNADQAYDPTQETADFQTDDAPTDYDTEDLPTFKWDEQTGLLTPVVGWASGTPAKKTAPARGGGSGGRGAPSGGGRGAPSGGGRGAPSGGRGSGGGQPPAQQQPYDDGYGGYGPYYGAPPDPSTYFQQFQPPSYPYAPAYGGGYPSAPAYGGYIPPGVMPMSPMNPFGGAMAYDPASGQMMPYFPGDSGDPNDPNDPNSLYNKTRAASGYGSAVPDEWGGMATPTAWGIAHAAMSAQNAAAQAAANEAYEENEYGGGY